MVRIGSFDEKTKLLLLNIFTVYYLFIFMQDALDPNKGFIKDDSIILEVHVAAEAPHGVA